MGRSRRINIGRFTLSETDELGPQQLLRDDYMPLASLVLYLVLYTHLTQPIHKTTYADLVRHSHK